MLECHPCQPCFLVVERTASGVQPDSYVWQEASGQLRDYIQSTYPEGYPGFGAIAIAKFVSFYEWVGGDNPIRDLHGDDTAFCLATHCQTVVGKLAYIRQRYDNLLL